MAETRKGSLGKKLLIILGVLLVLLIVVYFVATSAAFLKGVILPRVSKSIGADVTVADASIRPFSGVTLEKLKVQPPNAEPLVQADKVILRYSLTKILGGNIVVHEATLVSPVIRIVEDANGKSNLDVFTKGGEQPAPSKDQGKPGEPPQIAISNVSMKNATVQAIKKHADGREELTELSNLNVNIDRLANGQPGKLDISSAVKMHSVGTNGTANLLVGNLDGTFTYAFTKDLQPESVKGNTTFDTTSASGSFADLNGLKATIDADMSPTEIKNLAVQFAQRNEQLGVIRVSGPFDAKKQEGKLTIAISDIDRRVLNIAGGQKGIDFTTTRINSTNVLELANAGASVAFNGELLINSFSVAQTNQTTPKVDLVAKYNLAADKAKETAVINTFTLSGTQNKKPLLMAALSKPMTLQWGKAEGGAGESAFALTVTNLNLADWKAFAADLNPAGTANVNLTVVSQNSGKEIQFDFASRLNDFSASFGTNKIDQADIVTSARGRVSEMDKLDLAESRVEFAQGGAKAATASASGQYGLKSGEANMKAELEALLPKLLQMVQIPETEASSGRLTFNGQVTQKGANQSIVGKFALADFTGRNGETRLEKFNLNADADIQKADDLVQIRRLSAVLKHANQPGGSVNVSGNYNVKTQGARLELGLDNLNESVIRPFAAAGLGERKLVSININGNASATLSTNISAVIANLTVANLVVTEPKQKNPPAPLGAKLDVNVQQNQGVLNIQRLNAIVDYGGKPAGTFNVSGNYNTRDQRGKIDMNLTGLNQNAVKPFMPKLGGKDLVTISIDGNASANLNSTNDSAFKADFKVANLVVKDPKKAQADPALTAQLLLDAGIAKQVVDLRQLQVTLSPTVRAKNQLDIKGRVNIANTNAYEGNVTVNSEALDVTAFYDLVGGEAEAEKAGAPASAPAPAGPAAKDLNQEPDAVRLPVKQFTLDVNIGKFFLREIAITNLQTAVKIANNRVVLNPLQMSMNGAPVKGNVDLNLGVKGYAYNVAFSADKVPLEPLANTFIPEKRGYYKGEILANVNVKGAGTTGVNLKKTLGGELGFTFTNANIKIASPWMLKVVQPIAVALRVPELTESPLNWVHSEIKLGSGAINVQRAQVMSEAFKGSVAGVVPIADVLTNSPLNQFPVDIELRRSITSKLPKEILPRDIPPDAQYVLLPRFASLGGTLGDPKPKTDLTKLAVQAGTRLLEKEASKAIGGDAGRIIQGIFGTQQPQQQPAPTVPQTQPKAQTNQAVPAPNQPQSKTNAAPAQPPQSQTNAPTPAETINDVINIFRKKK